jgi:hypothetical protein
MPPGKKLKPLPWGVWGSFLLKNIFSIWKPTTLNKMAISKFLLDVFGEIVGVEGVLVAFQSLSTIKKGTRHSNFLSNEPFSMFLRQLLRYEVPWPKKKIYKINNSFCQRRSLLRHCYCAAYDYQCLLKVFIPIWTFIYQHVYEGAVLVKILF